MYVSISTYLLACCLINICYSVLSSRWSMYWQKNIEAQDGLLLDSCPGLWLVTEVACCLLIGPSWRAVTWANSTNTILEVLAPIIASTLLSTINKIDLTIENTRQQNCEWRTNWWTLKEFLFNKVQNVTGRLIGKVSKLTIDTNTCQKWTDSLPWKSRRGSWTVVWTHNLWRCCHWGRGCQHCSRAEGGKLGGSRPENWDYR